MRLLSDNEFININIDIDINNNDNVIIIDIIIDINIIIMLYKMFTKRVNEIIKRKRRNYDIYNNFKFIL